MCWNFILAFADIRCITEKEFLRKSQSRQVEKQNNSQGFSIRLKAARKRAGISQERLAEIVGKTKGAVGNWETGENQPGPDTLRKVAAAVGQSVDYLLTGEGGYVASIEAKTTGEKGKCVRYLEEFLERCETGDQVSWTYIELRIHFPLDKWTKQPAAKQLSAEELARLADRDELDAHGGTGQTPGTPRPGDQAQERAAQCPNQEGSAPKPDEG